MSSNDFGLERPKPWNIYTSSNSSPSEPLINQDSPWKSVGTSMNAISFGFVATAILISMFLIMAIFEHLFRPDPSFSSPDHVVNNASSSEPRSKEKFGDQQRVSTSYASDFSVMMPGHQYPTYIAQPAPLPCQREGVYWPPHGHEHNFVYP